MGRLGVLLLAASSLSTSAATPAADAAEESPLGGFHYFVGAHATLPAFASSKTFDFAAGVTIGVGYRFNTRLAATVDYLYGFHRLKKDLIPDPAVKLTGGQRLQWSTLDISYELTPPRQRVSLSIMAGAGVYWRRVSIEQITGVELVPFCSPATFVCFQSPQPATSLLGARSSTDGGLNAGLNVAVSLGYPIQVFVEPRFHFIFGPVVDTPTGPQRAYGYYLPIVFGFHYF
jgi:hypothetical protein